MSSGSVETPSAGLTATNIGFSAVKPIGRKSRGSISGRFGAHRRQRDEGRERRHEQRIAVGRGFGGGARGNAAIGAGMIDDDELLSHALVRPSAAKRASTSGVEPGAASERIVTGLFG